MSFIKLIEDRYSVRGYINQPVEEEKLKQILEAARIAPTAANRQAFKVVVIPTSKYEEQLKRLYDRKWFIEAPIILGIYAMPAQNWVRKDGVNYGYVDAAIVTDHIILTATQLGLGTCWVGAFDTKVAKEFVPSEEGLEAVAFTPIGYANSDIARRNKVRENLEDLVIYL